jgi:enolase
MSEIIDIHAREILDSRGNPTVEVDVILEDGTMGRAAVPSGASTGAHEAVEQRDGDKTATRARACRRPSMRSTADLRCTRRHGRHRAGGSSTRDDRARRHAQQGKLGANAILGVSLAHRQGRGGITGMPLYRYVGGTNARCPAGADDEHHQWRRACRQPDRHPGIHDHAGRRGKHADAVRMGAEVFHTLKKALHGRPQHQCRRRRRLRAEPQELDREALDFIMKSIEKAGYTPGEDVAWRSIAPPPNSTRTASTSWRARASR